MDASLAGVVPAGVDAPARGADLLGWSVLPLVTSTPDAGPWLFVTGRSGGWLSRGRLADADFVHAAAEYHGRWPFADAALAGVVVDGDALVSRNDSAAIDRVLAEAARVTRGGGNVLIVCGDRLVPRRLREWRSYGRQSAPAWRRAATRLGNDARAAAFLRLDGDRLTDLTIGGESAPDPAVTRDADRVVLLMSAANGTHTAIQSMLDAASRCTGLALRIDRVAVRKIGKTAAFLSGDDGRRYIMRVARSPIARARAERNFAALEWLHRSSLDQSLRCRVPAPVHRGAEGGYEFFVESCLDGEAGPLPDRHRTSGDGWATEAVAFITSLHRATAERTPMDGGALARLVLDPIDRVKRACHAAGLGSGVFDRVAARCEAALGARELPLVHTHGDFTDSNCLFDADGRLTAVVDWEVSERSGLPLLDLLQLMPIKDENSQHPRWQRFDAWLDLCRAPDQICSDPVFGPYTRTLGLDPAVVPALVLAQWATHIADRIDARRDDARWMRVRVAQPLESLERIVCD